MVKPLMKRVIFRQYHSSGSYSEREAVAATHLSTSALVHLRTEGLVPGEVFSGEVHYSDEDVLQLRRIRRLQHDLGINLAGVEVILDLLKRLDALHRELDQQRKQP